MTYVFHYSVISSHLSSCQKSVRLVTDDFPELFLLPSENWNQIIVWFHFKLAFVKLQNVVNNYSGLNTAFNVANNNLLQT